MDSAESLMQFAGPGFTYPLTRQQLDKSLSDENRLAFKLVGTGSEMMVGYAEIYLTPESAYLGRILIGNPLDRGKGLGSQLVTLLVTYAFTVLAKAKVQLNVFEWNTGAIRCYEKAGFKWNLEKKSGADDKRKDLDRRKHEFGQGRLGTDAADACTGSVRRPGR